ncbi:unnamed protein product, partial [Heterosigma akashiwo]
GSVTPLPQGGQPGRRACSAARGRRGRQPVRVQQPGHRQGRGASQGPADGG